MAKKLRLGLDPRSKFLLLTESYGWFVAMSGCDASNIRLYDPWGRKTLYTIEEAWNIEEQRRQLFKEKRHEAKVPV